MQSFVIISALLAVASAINPILDGETTGAHAMEDIGAPKPWIEKMKTSFSRLRKLYCDPDKLDDKKIQAVHKCDPTTNFDISHQCEQEAFQGKSLNDRRKFECKGGDAMNEIDHHIKDCIHRKAQESKTKLPEAIPTQEIKTMTHDQFMERIVKITNEIQSCLEKAVA